jgi:hydroxymethylpyrimidine kinase/phosphomethylpyrimidine kinase
MEAESNFLSQPARALTIAGFDPSGGAGVLADLSTFAAFGLTASAAITSITFQNRIRGFGAIDQSAAGVRAQVLPLLEDFTFVCTKTGMLPTAEVVREVVRLFRETDLPRPVVDPVIMSSSGQRLMEENALAPLIKELLPLARVLTPNVPEAETLTGTTITSEEDMRRAAAMIRELGARAVLIKGGHLGEPGAGGRRQTAGGIAEEAIDVLDNDARVTVFREQRIAGPGIRGSGCILSAAITAGLGQGMTLEDSVRAAKSFVLRAIRQAQKVA